MDSDGKTVKSLPADALHVWLGDNEDNTISAEYDPVSAIWVIVATFRGKKEILPVNSILLEIDYLGLQGRDTAEFSIAEHVPLSVKIGYITPGNREDPLFYMLVPLGFSLDIYADVGGSAAVGRENIQVYIGRFNVTDSISYVSSTNKGIRIHLTGVVLCPDPPRPNTSVKVEVRVIAGKERASDYSYIYIRGNPGNWKNLIEAGCKNRGRDR